MVFQGTLIKETKKNYRIHPKKLYYSTTIKNISLFLMFKIFTLVIVPLDRMSYFIFKCFRYSIISIIFQKCRSDSTQLLSHGPVSSRRPFGDLGLQPGWLVLSPVRLACLSAQEWYLNWDIVGEINSKDMELWIPTWDFFSFFTAFELYTIKLTCLKLHISEF